MTDFIKLTQITGRKVENDEKTATGVKPIYVRPWDIESFSQDEDGVTVVKFNNHECIHVAETPEKIYEMIHKEEREYTPIIPSVPFTSPYRDPLKESKGWWYDFDWWNHPTITCDTISKNTPYYGYAIVFGNGEVWE